MAKKSIRDLERQYRRIESLYTDLGLRDYNAGNKEGVKRNAGRLAQAAKTANRYITNSIKSQTKGLTEEELNAGRGASYDRKNSRSTYMGLGGKG